MVKPFKLALILVVVAVVSSCVSTDSKTFQSATVLGVGSDEASSLCADFRLTNGQAQQILNRAKPITARQMHDHYNYLPCYAEGEVMRLGQTQQSCDFTVRAGGTVELTCEDGQNYIYACDTCEELLMDRPATAE